MDQQPSITSQRIALPPRIAYKQNQEASSSSGQIQPHLHQYGSSNSKRRRPMGRTNVAQAHLNSFTPSLQQGASSVSIRRLPMGSSRPEGLVVPSPPALRFNDFQCNSANPQHANKRKRAYAPGSSLQTQSSSSNSVAPVASLPLTYPTFNQQEIRQNSIDHLYNTDLLKDEPVKINEILTAFAISLVESLRKSILTTISIFRVRVALAPN